MSAAPQLAVIPLTHKWISADEVMKRTGWSRATFFRRRAELISRESGETDSAGRPIRIYFEDSLPLPNTAAQSQLALVAPPPAQLGPLFANQPAAAMERIVLPNAAAQAQADKRLAALEPLLQFLETPARFAAFRLADGRPVTSLERMVEYVAQCTNQSTRTIKRWLASYRAQGFAGLADRIRTDKGQSRWFAKHYQAAIFAAHLYLNERQSISFICDQMRYELQALDVECIDDLPSHETVRVFLAQSVSPSMKALARDGQRIYRERMAPYLRRAYVDVFANQIWVGDHAIHDAEISNDLFDEVPFGTPGRLRMSAFVDYRSRKAWATWAWEGSSRSIAATIVRAMLEDGPPEGIYVDNGKDYKKVARGAVKASELPGPEDDDQKAPANWWEQEYTDIERAGLLRRLGISVTHCIPRHPQSKHVERFFRTMHMHFDAVHTTYTSGSPFTRPESTEKAMMRHRWLLKAGRVQESGHPLASRFILGCLAWIEEYNNTPQSGEGMDGATPNEIFAAERNPNQKPTPDLKDLALLMRDYVRRRVRECAITLGKHRYTPAPEDRMAWAAMHEANEQDVLVGYNAADPEYATVLDLDGRLIAWLEAEPLVRFAPNDDATQAQIGESMEIRRGLEKATRKSLAAIATAARAQGIGTAEDLLYKRLQLPAAGGTEVITQRTPRPRPDKRASAPSTAADIASNFLEALK